MISDLRSQISKQKFLDRIHESSSVGARPSPAAPIEFNVSSRRMSQTAVLNMSKLGVFCIWFGGVCWMGAAGDGRAPTEELSCIRSESF
jgi:hypothetical protein